MGAAYPTNKLGRLSKICIAFPAITQKPAERPQGLYMTAIPCILLSRRQEFEGCSVTFCKIPFRDMGTAGKLPARPEGRVKRGLSLESMHSCKQCKGWPPPPKKSMKPYLVLSRGTQAIWGDSCNIGNKVSDFRLFTSGAGCLHLIGGRTNLINIFFCIYISIIVVVVMKFDTNHWVKRERTWLLM